MKPKAASLDTRIRADIRGRILSGEWRPGFRIPFEHELVVQYGCSRATVNKALSALARAGLIERRKRAGSFVAEPPLQAALLEIPDIRTSVEERGETYGFRLLRAATLDGAPDPDGATLAPPLLSLEGLHLANGRPLACETRLLSLAVVPQAAAADFSAEPPGSWLLQHVAWTRAWHRVSAVTPDREVAARLDIGRRTGCLQIERRTWRLDEGITFVRQIFPGDRYDLVGEFTPAAKA